MSKKILIQILATLSFPTQFRAIDWKQLKIEKFVENYGNNSEFIYKAFTTTQKSRLASQDWYRRTLIHVLTQSETLRAEPTTLALLQQIVTEHQFSEVVRIEAVLALIHCFPEHSSLLRQLATDKNNPLELRYYAILGQPEILLWLQEIAVDTTFDADISYFIRSRALDTLSHFQNRSEIFYHLKQIITQLCSPQNNRMDIDRWEIFELAMAVLAYHARVNAEARLFLTQRVVNAQQTDYFRKVALYVLAANFQDDSDILALVTEFLTNRKIAYHIKIDFINELCSFTKYVHHHLDLLPLLWQTIIDKPTAVFGEGTDDGLISGLVGSFREQPATLSGLHAMIRKQLTVTKTVLEKLRLEDEVDAYDAQCEAFWALAHYFHDHAETLPLILQTLTEPQMPDAVRCNLIAILVEQYRHRAEILPLLEEIAIDALTSDEMRGCAIEAVMAWQKKPTR